MDFPNVVKSTRLLPEADPQSATSPDAVASVLEAANAAFAKASSALSSAQATLAAANAAAVAAGLVATSLTAHENLSTQAHGGIVSANDARLSDARTPTAHDHSGYETAGAAAAVQNSLAAHTAATTEAHGGLVPASSVSATPGANKIPQADANGMLDNWVSDYMIEVVTYNGTAIQLTEDNAGSNELIRLTSDSSILIFITTGIPYVSATPLVWYLEQAGDGTATVSNANVTLSTTAVRTGGKSQLLAILQTGLNQFDIIGGIQ